jgi:hypothetical protein
MEIETGVSMRIENIQNDFFQEKTTGPKLENTLADLVEMAVGGRLYMSKRLSPAGTICNGRVYSDKGEYLFSSDINVFDCARRLTLVADLAGCELFILSEHGNNAYWRSSKPDMWLGGIFDEFTKEELEPPVPFYRARPYLEKRAEEVQRQWRIDHGVQRRNPKEWLCDCWRRIKYSDTAFYIRKLYRNNFK